MPRSPAVPFRRDAPQPRPAAAEAYRRLKDAILTARFAPGAPLSDHQFAEEIGTSRTPVREAILRLQMPGCGTADWSAPTRRPRRRAAIVRWADSAATTIRHRR
jgi:DNA-binding FadR family transcriptional regulator